MPLDNLQKLASAPYFDDFSEQKNFHRILFRPAVAVQVRELNQLQSIFQNQIERFAGHIFKEGSVVSGCSMTGYNNWRFIAVMPVQESAGTTVDLDSDLIGHRFRQTTVVNGVITHDARGTIVQFKFGYAGNNDPSKLFYLKDSDAEIIPGQPIQLFSSTDRYIDRVELQLTKPIGIVNSPTTIVLAVGDLIDGATSGARGLISEIVNPTTIMVERTFKDFVFGESITKTTDAAATSTLTFVDRKLGTLVGTVQTYSSATRPATANFAVSGSSFGVGISDGVVYQKGHFIRMAPQTTIVNEFAADPSNKLVGFQTVEEFITENVDSSLFDNAAGTPNTNAPGAHRLRLTPTLVVKTRPLTIADGDFLPIIEYGPEGAAFERTDPQYAALGDEIAKRTFEESGNYVIRPFNINTTTNRSAADKINYNIGGGLAYVRGRRIETRNAFLLSGQKGTDTTSYSSQLVSTTTGNYLRVSQLYGAFGEHQSARVQLLTNAVAAASNTAITRTTAAGGDVIGSANIRNLELESGVAGQPNAVWRAHLFQVTMVGNNSISSVRTMRRAAGAGDTAPFSYADVVLDGGIARLHEQEKRPMVWELGVDAVKNLRDASNNYTTSFNYTHVGAAVFNGTTREASFAIPADAAFAFTTIDAKSKVVVIAEADIVTNPLVGTATTNATSIVTGTGTQFLNDFAAGDFITVGANTRQVASVETNTSLTTTSAFPTASGAYTRLFRSGQVINTLTPTRTIAVTNSNNLTLSIGASGGYSLPSAALTIRLFATKGTSSIWANPIRKQVRRKVLVRIDTSTAGPAGPWNLGVPDVFLLRGVYEASRHRANNAIVSSTSFDTSKNHVGDFVLRDGQTATQYNHASIALRPTVPTDRYANTIFLAEFDCFAATADAAGEGGFFSVESYPVNDNLNANTASTIATVEIPSVFVDTFNATYDLRNCIDFRPYRQATANLAAVVSTSTINPSPTELFNTLTTTFNPHPSSGLFRTNFTHYLPRRDVIVINPEGRFEVVQGIPSKNPKFPSIEDESLIIGRVNLSPYPSTADDQQSAASSAWARPRTTIQQVTQRRFTMQDISAIENRVTRLEYYATLNSLELSAKDLLITDEAGNDRFKNGFLVDPFNSHAIGRIDSPEYRITIDEDDGVAIPFTTPLVFPIELDVNTSSNFRVTGDMVTLSYTDEAFITQPFASAFRKPDPQIGQPPVNPPGNPFIPTPIPSPVTYNGFMEVLPGHWTQDDYNTQTTGQTGSSEWGGPFIDVRVGSFTKAGAKIGVAMPKRPPTFSEDQLIPLPVTHGPSVGGEPLIVHNNQMIGAKQLSFTADGLRPNTNHSLVIGGRFVVGNSYTSNGRGAFDEWIFFTFPGNEFPVGTHAIELKSNDGESYASTSVTVGFTAINNPGVITKPQPRLPVRGNFDISVHLSGDSSLVVGATAPAASRQLSFTATLDQTDLNRVINQLGNSIIDGTIHFHVTGGSGTSTVAHVVADPFSAAPVCIVMPTDNGGTVSAFFRGTAWPSEVQIETSTTINWEVAIATPMPKPPVSMPPRTMANVAIQTFNSAGAAAFASSGVGFTSMSGVASQDSNDSSGVWSISAVTTSGPPVSFSASGSWFSLTVSGENTTSSVTVSATYTLNGVMFTAQTVLTLEATASPPVEVTPPVVRHGPWLQIGGPAPWVSPPEPPLPKPPVFRDWWWIDF